LFITRRILLIIISISYSRSIICIISQTVLQTIYGSEAQRTLDLFEFDLRKHSFEQLTVLLWNKRESHLLKYGTQGLRTLDNIQLSTFVSLFSKSGHIFQGR